MCGIVGYTGPPIDGLLDSMIEVIRPRGPDGEGRFSAAGVHLGHTRLAVIDVEGGAQPMSRHDGRFVVVYNGEIYNYDELRQELEAAGQVFTSHCDTELLPLAFAAWGEQFVARLNGMFAFALYDRQTGRLLLARDHLGIKPLYYARAGSQLVFASIGNAVALHPDVGRRLRPEAVAELLQFRYVRSGCHLYAGIETLPPGHLGIWSEGALELRPFWTARRRDGSSTDPELVGRAAELFEQSVAMQLRSDVPLGIFLSGGVDSGTLAHFAARHAEDRLTGFTFSIGGDTDETAAAGAIAAACGIQQEIIHFDRTAAFGRFAEVAASMDTPVGDAIVLPTYMLCEAAAQQCKVVLTGEGADELFGGYAHFPVLRTLGRLSRHAPWLRHLAPLIRRVPVTVLNRFFDYQASLGRLGREAAAEMVGALDDRGTVLALAGAVLGDRALAEATTLGPPPPRADHELSLAGVMHDFARTWLPHQILLKMDQLSMAHGLEARVPYLDYRIYDLLCDAADAMFIQPTETKVLLRRIAERENVVAARRRKAAFHVPMESAYRDELRSLARDWLSPEVNRRHGILRQPFVERTLAQAERGEFLASKRLMNMMTLNMWLDAHGGAL